MQTGTSCWLRAPEAKLIASNIFTLAIAMLISKGHPYTNYSLSTSAAVACSERSDCDDSAIKGFFQLFCSCSRPPDKRRSNIKGRNHPSQWFNIWSGKYTTLTTQFKLTEVCKATQCANMFLPFRWKSMRVDCSTFTAAMSAHLQLIAAIIGQAHFRANMHGNLQPLFFGWIACVQATADDYVSQHFIKSAES